MTEDNSGRYVVVGVDGTEPGDIALRYALREAARHNARLVAVWAWEPPIRSVAEYYGLQEYDKTTLDTAHERSAREHIYPIVGQEPGVQDVAVEVHAGSGPPAEILIDAARGADLLVVGHRSRSSLRAVALGSVALSCVLHAPCPVLVVPPVALPENSGAPQEVAATSHR